MKKHYGIAIAALAFGLSGCSDEPFDYDGVWEALDGQECLLRGANAAVIEIAHLRDSMEGYKARIVETPPGSTQKSNLVQPSEDGSLTFEVVMGINMGVGVSVEGTSEIRVEPHPDDKDLLILTDWSRTTRSSFQAPTFDSAMPTIAAAMDGTPYTVTPLTVCLGRIGRMTESERKKAMEETLARHGL